MDTHLLVASLSDTVAEASDYLRLRAAEVDQNHDLWVVDDEGLSVEHVREVRGEFTGLNELDGGVAPALFARM